ncbi:uncharacterized protein LOC131938944 [Physella acuta]|uniref:uncharacterized protein LOC131938944 n=1 Tax=Physella acuta TaxID=109671 RepID=UPI0027DB074F|nr:uncharacterized protein LOC131938944 [Physella acuta]XP_059153173.1 uncharacterized protein LOC131938944 [Physella acuta]XP_059153174.1 uncharacterized protein LOC131938944 [Physella acuta]
MTPQFLILALTIGLAWCGPLTNRCPQPTEGIPNPYTFLYGSPDDCQTFFMCNHGNPIRMSCPATTTFSETYQTCVNKDSHFDTCTRENAIRECSRGSTLIPHPTACQRYYNCSDNTTRSIFSRFTQFEMECPYPQLFDVTERRCKPYREAYCGPERVAATDACDYYRNKCDLLARGCRPCRDWFPSCTGLADGIYEDPFRRWSSRYIQCEDERVENMNCPNYPVGYPGIFSPIKKQCVSLWEVPRTNGGLAPSCDGKAAGKYKTEEIDSVYFTCPSGDVSYCPNGKVFNEATQQCQ